MKCFKKVYFCVYFRLYSEGKYTIHAKIKMSVIKKQTKSRGDGQDEAGLGAWEEFSSACFLNIGRSYK